MGFVGVIAMNSRRRKKLRSAKKTQMAACPSANAIVKTTISHHAMRARELTAWMRARFTAASVCEKAQLP